MKVENIDMANRIRQARIDKGITATKLAEIMDVSLKSVSCWQCATKSPTLEHIIKLSLALDVSIDYIVFGRCAND